MKALPLARHASLIVKKVDGETLVYDQLDDKAHCLNDTAALIWESCDGQTSVGEIAQRIGVEVNSPVDENVVWLALEQLEKFKLLDQAPAKPTFISGLTRRQMVARVGLAAIALPAIASIVVPTAQAQTSLLAPFICCTNPNQCVSGNCIQDPTCVVVPGSPTQSTKRCA